jgi:hypothetical protein
MAKEADPRKSEQFGLAVLDGDKLVMMANGDWQANPNKRVVVSGQIGGGMCAKSEEWQMPEDLENAFDPAPP